jgi:hypothetical protein
MLKYVYIILASLYNDSFRKGKNSMAAIFTLNKSMKMKRIQSSNISVQVFMVVNAHLVVFWVVLLCNFAIWYQH